MRILQNDKNNFQKLQSDDLQKLAQAFEILIDIDKRVNPQLYQKPILSFDPFRERKSLFAN